MRLLKPLAKHVMIDVAMATLLIIAMTLALSAVIVVVSVPPIWWIK